MIAPRTARPGRVLVVFVLTLTALLGTAAVVIDGGTLRTNHRKLQNVADSAALAAAMDLMRGSSVSTATTTATTFVQTYNGMSDATVTVNSPPTSGPYSGTSHYVEVTVTRPSTAVFLGAAGMGSNTQTISARAVAGYEPVASGEGAIVLDPRSANAPGLSFSGTNTRLKVKGTVVVNNQANGWDQYGTAVPTGSSPSNPYAITTSSSVVSDPTQAYIQARAVQVVGGVDTPANLADYDDPTNNPSPLFARSTVGPDPLRTLPVPKQSNTPWITNWTSKKAAVSVSNSNQNVTLDPGIYPEIEITGGTVTFNPGVYIISPDSNGSNKGLKITGGTVTGSGVMFYLTGSTYLNTSAGYWDEQDGTYDGPLPPTNGSFPSNSGEGTVRYAPLSVSGGTGNISLSGLAFDATNPSDRILFYARRRNDTAATISGGGSGNVTFDIKGTIYAKWARFTLSGGGTYDAQFIVGSLELKGGATMTINGTGINRGRANQVFLVE